MAIGWAQAAVPVAFAVVGLGAVAVGAQQQADPAPVVVWIDAPLDAATLAPGEVEVVAHASASNAPSELDLLVDGVEVGSDPSLERTDHLVVARITWSADAGSHVLVVRTPDGTESQPRTVIVAPAGETPLTSTTTTVPNAPTTTNTGPVATTPTTSPAVTVTSTTTSATAPVRPPEITSATVSDPMLSPDPACTALQATVDVTATDATSARLRVLETEYALDMFPSPTGWTGTIPSGFAGRVGTYDVEVEVTGPGGTAGTIAGRVSMRIDCPAN